MPDPHSTLSIFAEVAVALAGFSGIVIAFGRRKVGALTALERRRLSNLFMLSGMVLFMAMLCMALLHVAALETHLLWAGSSALIFLLATPWLALDTIRLRRLEASERADIKIYVLIPFNTMGVAALLLQVFNAFWLQEAWPFFLVLVVAITGAFQQFILLVRMGVRDV
jgi:hypothetical protein